MLIIFFFSWKFQSRDILVIMNIDLVWKKSHNKIQLGEFDKDQKFPEKKK